MPASNRHAHHGLALLIAGAAIDSTGGLFTRLLPTDGFTNAAGRAVFALLILGAVLLFRDRQKTFATPMGIGFWGVLFSILNALGMVLTMVSLQHTAVANYYMIFATAPFAAAIAGRLALGEPLEKMTLLAAVAGFIGIAIMMLSGARGGGLLGDLLACLVVLTYSGTVLALRRDPRIDILPVICTTTFFSWLFALPFADFGIASTRDWLILVAFGVIQIGFGSLLIFNAVKRIPAGQSGLLGILNAAFAPIWVFVFLGEVPPTSTLIGGAIILGAAAVHLGWTIATARRLRAAS